jgi:hypothetical protein
MFVNVCATPGGTSTKSPGPQLHLVGVGPTAIVIAPPMT